jgi:DNA-binding XRE family transcriptional regulator
MDIEYAYQPDSVQFNGSISTGVRNRMYRPIPMFEDEIETEQNEVLRDRSDELSFKPLAKAKKAPYTFHKRLKEDRTKSAFTTRYLAMIVGCSRALIAQYESCRRRPSMKRLIKLADIFQPEVNRETWRKEFFASAGFVELDPDTMPQGRTE